MKVVEICGNDLLSHRVLQGMSLEVFCKGSLMFQVCKRGDGPQGQTARITVCPQQYLGDATATTSKDNPMSITIHQEGAIMSREVMEAISDINILVGQGTVHASRAVEMSTLKCVIIKFPKSFGTYLPGPSY